MIWNQILCLGDSLTYGARDRYGRSYPAELGKLLTEKTGEFYICHNYGINGETSSDLLRRSWNIIKSNKDCKIKFNWKNKFFKLVYSIHDWLLNILLFHILIPFMNILLLSFLFFQ